MKLGLVNSTLKKYRRELALVKADAARAKKKRLKLTVEAREGAAEKLEFLIAKLKKEYPLAS